MNSKSSSLKNRGALLTDLLARRAPRRVPKPLAGEAVRGQAVRKALGGIYLGERSPVLDRPGAAVEVERVDTLCRAVDEVHPVAGRTPAQSVGDRRAAHDSLQIRPRFEPVQ